MAGPCKVYFTYSQSNPHKINDNITSEQIRDPRHRNYVAYVMLYPYSMLGTGCNTCLRLGMQTLPHLIRISAGRGEGKGLHPGCSVYAKPYITFRLNSYIL